MSENHTLEDLSYIWTTEKDNWFLVLHVRENFNLYNIGTMVDNEIVFLRIVDGEENQHHRIVAKMLENGNRIITEEEYRSLLPKRTLWQRLGNRLFLYYQRIGLSIVGFILHHKSLENLVVKMLERSKRYNQRP